MLALFLAFALHAPAQAQLLAMHQPATSAAGAAPAKAAATAIIPGSPLAALAGVAAPADPDSDAGVPAPFGTSAIGLSITSAIGAEATQTFGEFLSAVRQSTRLTPVVQWLDSFSGDAIRRAHLADVLMALLITVLPGLAVEAAIRFGLTRPRAAVVRQAVPRFGGVAEDDAEAGLADAEAGETEKRPRRRVSLLAWGRKLFFGILHFGLEIVPLVGFVATLQSLIAAGVLTTRPAHLAVIGIANAYLFCRLVMESLRFLVEPGAASLRLVRMPEFRAGWLMRWVRLLLATGLVGFVLVSIAQLLGLSRDGANVLMRLTVLAIHVEIAVAIWQSRRLVGRWIAGPPEQKGVFAGFRRRMGKIWHYFALFYVLALWIAWAGGVHNAFWVLLRVVLVFIAAMALGRTLWTGSAVLLERAFPDPSTSAARRPVLFARARAYNPLIRALIRIVIGIAVAVLILQGWGVDAFGWLFSDPFSRSLLSAFVKIVINVTVALVLWECANAYLNGRIERLTTTGRARHASRLRTLLPMIKATIGVAIFLVAGLICLSNIGVNAAPLLAGAGVLGIAVGFGSQKLVQDIITGLFLLLEDAMQVGDVVSLASMTGTVERLSIRTIRLRGGDGSINIIPFSAVTTVTNMTRDFGYAQISIQVSYEEDLPRVYAVLTDIARTMRKEAAWSSMMRDDLQIFGLDQFGASALVITGQIRTGPGQHWAVRREFYARVKDRFEAEHIEMPYTYLPPPPAPTPAAPPAVAASKQGEA
jgi:small conductance mechanosensitive channel